MQLASVLASLLLASTTLAVAIPSVDEIEALVARDIEEIDLDTLKARADNTTITDIDIPDDGIPGVPDFDPLELALDESLVQVEERDVGDEDLGVEMLVSEGAEGESKGGKMRRAASGQKIVDCAKGYSGTRYLYGGCKSKAPFGPSPGGLDCSCLSRTCVYKGTGKTIPRTTQTQYPYSKCTRISRSSAKPGDLLFWGCNSAGANTGGIHHVGIFSRKGYIWHAPKTGDHVREAKIWTSGICRSAVRCW